MRGGAPAAPGPLHAAPGGSQGRLGERSGSRVTEAWPDGHRRWRSRAVTGGLGTHTAHGRRETSPEGLARVRPGAGRPVRHLAHGLRHALGVGRDRGLAAVDRQSGRPRHRHPLLGSAACCRRPVERRCGWADVEWGAVEGWVCSCGGGVFCRATPGERGPARRSDVGHRGQTLGWWCVAQLIVGSTTSATTQLTLSGPPASFAAAIRAWTALSGVGAEVRRWRIRGSGTTRERPSEHRR